MGIKIYLPTYPLWLVGFRPFFMLAFLSGLSLPMMGLIIPAMLIRISKGHTGRKMVFDTLDKFVLWVMMLAFVLLAWRYISFLFQPRIDGKEL